jgi:hypothetical protein
MRLGLALSLRVVARHFVIGGLHKLVLTLQKRFANRLLNARILQVANLFKRSET